MFARHLRLTLFTAVACLRPVDSWISYVARQFTDAAGVTGQMLFMPDRYGRNYCRQYCNRTEDTAPWLTTGQPVLLNVQGGPQNWHNFCMPQLYQILTDFQNYFTVRIRRKFAITIPPHLSCVANLLHYLVKCRALKATIENKTTSVTTHFKKLTSWNTKRCSKCYLLIFL